LELNYLTELRKYAYLYDISKSLKIYGYRLDHDGLLYAMLCAFGVGFRLIALILLLCSKPTSTVQRLLNDLKGYWKTTNWKIFSRRLLKKENEVTERTRLIIN
jgi:hypothetical protein